MAFTTAETAQPRRALVAERDGQSAFYRRLGGRLKSRRVAAGLSQERVAEHIGLSFQQVQKYESGANRPPLAELTALAELLGCSLSDLVDATDGEPEAAALVDRRLLDVSRYWQGMNELDRAAVRDLCKALATARQGGA